MLLLLALLEQFCIRENFLEGAACLNRLTRVQHSIFGGNTIVAAVIMMHFKIPNTQNLCRPTRILQEPFTVAQKPLQPITSITTSPITPRLSPDTATPFTPVPASTCTSLHPEAFPSLEFSLQSKSFFLLLTEVTFSSPGLQLRLCVLGLQLIDLPQ